jgi:hypothetical protein
MPAAFLLALKALSVTAADDTGLFPNEMHLKDRSFDGTDIPISDAFLPGETALVLDSCTFSNFRLGDSCLVLLQSGSNCNISRCAFRAIAGTDAILRASDVRRVTVTKADFTQCTGPSPCALQCDELQLADTRFIDCAANEKFIALDVGAFSVTNVEVTDCSAACGFDLGKQDRFTGVRFIQFRGQPILSAADHFLCENCSFDDTTSIAAGASDWEYRGCRFEARQSGMVGISFGDAAVAAVRCTFDGLAVSIKSRQVSDRAFRVQQSNFSGCSRPLEVEATTINLMNCRFADASDCCLAVPSAVTGITIFSCWFGLTATAAGPAISVAWATRVEVRNSMFVGTNATVAVELVSGAKDFILRDCCFAAHKKDVLARVSNPGFLMVDTSLFHCDSCNLLFEEAPESTGRSPPLTVPERHVISPVFSLRLEPPPRPVFEFSSVFAKNCEVVVLFENSRQPPPQPTVNRLRSIISVSPRPHNEPRKTKRRLPFGAGATLIALGVGAAFALRLRREGATDEYGFTDDQEQSRELKQEEDPDDVDTATEQQPNPADTTDPD